MRIYFWLDRLFFLLFRSIYFETYCVQSRVWEAATSWRTAPTYGTTIPVKIFWCTESRVAVFYQHYSKCFRNFSQFSFQVKTVESSTFGLLISTFKSSSFHLLSILGCDLSLRFPSLKTLVVTLGISNVKTSESYTSKSWSTLKIECTKPYKHTMVFIKGEWKVKK